MKYIIEFLKNNGIEYEYVTYGNPYYYNDGFTVQAISVKFNYDLADNIKELEKKEDKFLKSMKRRKSHCIGHSSWIERLIMHKWQDTIFVSLPFLIGMFGLLFWLNIILGITLWDAGIN